ncbi:P-loop containing nucleoside triphosphate hydrolase protein [Lentinula aff. lateritia]|uniref:P-loop containing nucleoside triphosphate hydrolase protein n=1 Tax=Lentinula aff. lateritia TaxID=2804960 RepID=A0ACC1TRA2_9AGAR|nr:P-loop containing nucleoside triphosphate hydrolase protein [Lentinula aff. lateritia]
MPPRKGIVKSGNAGNSSKFNGKETVTAGRAPEAAASSEKSLFPPGSKYPASLLHERCQKNGWEKPIIDTVSVLPYTSVIRAPQKKNAAGWFFVVTLSRYNKTGEKESVRFEPHPPYFRPSPLEARHWGATYALYRFSNSLQLNRVLPRGPSDYWNELAAEHKQAPEHMDWMYNADPFAARKQVDERQARAAEKRAQTVSSAESGENSRKGAVSGSGEFSQAPEVRMALALRDQVEEAVKQGLSMFSGYDTTRIEDPLTIDADNAENIIQQLTHLGFKSAQARKTVEFLSKPSPTTERLLSMLSPLDASIEYLVLHLPEDALPERFLPSINSSNPFVTGLHSGSDNLKARWTAERAIKEAGWPVHLVKEFMDAQYMDDWNFLITMLGKKLIGDDSPVDKTDEIDECFPIDAQEAEAFGGHFEDPNHLVMPMFSAPVTLHVLILSGSYPRRAYAPMYITGPSIPGYVRLHLLSCLLFAVKDPEFLEDDEGFCSAAMRCLEDVWAKVEDQGPPDLLEVLKHAIPSPITSSKPTAVPANTLVRTKKEIEHNTKKRDTRSSEQIKVDFDQICQSKKYCQILSERKKLPSFTVEAQFLNLLESNQVVVVVGETGCGKTTQLPQFILDSLIKSHEGSSASILVTQPRRLSAIGVAKRVSAERLDDGSVGYAIRGESNWSQKTKMLFCTTGVVLRRLSLGDRLEDVTHIVVDEVHERSVDGDFLLLELKELLKRKSRIKIILMSATINHEIFIRYFDGAPLITIPGFTHLVTDRYLEDFIQELDYQPSAGTHMKGANKIRDSDEDVKSLGLNKKSISVLQTITRSNSIDYRLIAALASHIMATSRKRGGILIFLPGVQEIRQCIDALLGESTKDDALLLPLHANLSSVEQMKVFVRTSKWKIIVATNVAETSITIDDILYVVDVGKVKEVRYDPEADISRLVETWVTRAAARQRRGRAGRTQPGTCYKLYTRKQEENMAKYAVPEILRVPLEAVSLAVRVMRPEGDVKHYLAQAIDSPELNAMDTAWSTLKELGALDQQGMLTPLGHHISMLPIDIRLAKMLILGTIFRCLGPMLTIAACLSSKPLFVSPMDKREEAIQARARFSKGNSDLLTDMNAFNECLRLTSGGKSQSAVRQFCEKASGINANFISQSTLREISTLRRDYLGPLAAIGFVPLDSTPSSPGLNVNSSEENLLKALILGGLWPRVARVHLPKSAIKFDKVQGGTVQRENTAKEFKIFDIQEGRVFLHPSSVLFGHASWKSPFIAYFQKSLTTKIFLRDVTEVPIWSILLFGGPISINHVSGGLTVSTRDSTVKIRAWPRIGILVNHIRHLLEAKLRKCIEDGTMLNEGYDEPTIGAILMLLKNDGMSN